MANKNMTNKNMANKNLDLLIENKLFSNVEKDIYDNIVELCDVCIDTPVELLKVLDKITNKIKVYWDVSLYDKKMDQDKLRDLIIKNIFDVQPEYTTTLNYPYKDNLSIKFEEAVEKNIEIKVDIRGDKYDIETTLDNILNELAFCIDKDIIKFKASKMIIKRNLSVCTISSNVNGLKYGANELMLRLTYQLK